MGINPADTILNPGLVKKQILAASKRKKTTAETQKKTELKKITVRVIGGPSAVI